MSDTLHTSDEFRQAYADRTWEHYRALLCTVIEFAPPGFVLDVGAGLGLFVECCRQFGVPGVGLEGSSEGLALAKGRGVPLVAGVLEAGLPFRAESIAAVVCNQVIEHLHAEVARLLLSEAYRVLRPGGVILIESPSPRDRAQRSEPGHINLYTPSRLRAAVRNAGFVVLAQRNGAIAPLGHGRIRDLLFLGFLRLTGWHDLLSVSANVVARKTG